MTAFLDEHLGRRISTRELAAWLGLDVDAVRRNYQAFGGIRPIPKGKILFFERNVADALRSSKHGIEDNEGRAYSLEGAGPEDGPNQAETLQHQSGSFGMGGTGTRCRLGGEDRHGLLPEGLGGKVPRPRRKVRPQDVQREAAGPA